MASTLFDELLELGYRHSYPTLTGSRPGSARREALAEELAGMLNWRAKKPDEEPGPTVVTIEGPWVPARRASWAWSETRSDISTGAAQAPTAVGVGRPTAVAARRDDEPTGAGTYADAGRSSRRGHGVVQPLGAPVQ